MYIILMWDTTHLKDAAVEILEAAARVSLRDNEPMAPLLGVHAQVNHVADTCEASCRICLHDN